MYNALGIIILLILLAMAAAIVFTLVRSVKDGGEIISKKNLIYIVPIYLVIYSLHVIAAVYSGMEMNFFTCFALFGSTLEVIKFKTQSSMLIKVCQAYPLIYADFIIAYILCALAVILGVLSFFSQRIKNYINVRILLGRTCDIVVGESKDALKYLKNNKNCILLGTNITRQRYADLIKDGTPTLRLSFESKPFQRKIKKRAHSIMVFRDVKLPYTKLIESFAALRKEGANCDIFLEANQDEMKILKEKFISAADRKVASHISCFSRHELMARRFVVDYPITKYIPRSFYNDNFTIKNGKEINIVFIGFGKVNYQLFRMCSMQFQFAQMKGGKLAPKPVNYYVYDNEEKALNNEFFTRILFEQDEEFKNCDFPKPDRICNLEVEQLDINSVEAKKKFKSFVNDDSFTYFVVSLDNDLQDASYAQTVKRLLDDSENYRIFVRAKNNNGERLNEEDSSILYFGEEKKLYSHENIANDDLSELAKRINILYNRVADPPEWLKKLKHLPPEEQRRILNENLSAPANRQYMYEMWALLPPIERDSNLYHALNLPFKLNLLGYEMVKGATETGVSEAEFDTRYINYGRAHDYADYSFFFNTQSSNVLAFIEHSRWNALYIMYDYKQMKKADMQIVEELDKKGNKVRSLPHKDTDKKQHACITTYYGLDELIKFKFKTLYPEADVNSPDLNTDPRLIALSKIYKFDYMDLDKLYGEITAMGYVLKDTVKKDKK